MKKVRVKSRKISTTILLPKKKFIVGLGSVFNIRGQYFDYNTSDSESEADSKALRSDWDMIGEDINDAKRTFAKSF